ncbi:hypothetical protein HMPREF0591_5301 [Mycobacterium parascrofulaceum ATCC BAA-614]|uniref:Uncharacterized protein n=1 Tax=Mycobacterium parascrofulaceum ATCC BAA-614 TaxID=525368 RepID=D5PGK7_9MYCO|nr:hypothetical protein HMPREF0591_5301 [Mycobacterium parascrofulaceum ATCC BAA-614]
MDVIDLDTTRHNTPSDLPVPPRPASRTASSPTGSDFAGSSSARSARTASSPAGSDCVRTNRGVLGRGMPLVWRNFLSWGTSSAGKHRCGPNN